MGAVVQGIIDQAKQLGVDMARGIPAGLVH
jgi:hypothetical protein